MNLMFKSIRRFLCSPAHRAPAAYLVITDGKLRQLIRDFVVANENRQGLSWRRCLYHVRRVLQTRKCKCLYGRHSCYLKNCWQTPDDFVRLLQEIFTLNCEGMADALHHNSNFQVWCSELREDSCFGAKFDFFNADLSGNNILVNPPFNSFDGTDILLRVVDRCKQLTSAERPTRVVLLMPVFQGSGGDRFLKSALEPENSILMGSFLPGSFSFDPPDRYYLGEVNASVFPHGLAIILMCSSRSLRTDPVDCQKWRSKLDNWTDSRGIPRTADADCSLKHFVAPTTLPRTLGKMNEASILAYTPWLVRGKSEKLWLDTGATVLTKLTKLNAVLGVAGVLPRALKDQLPGALSARDDAFSSWSMSTLWGVYKMWNVRTALHRAWGRRNVVSECPSIYHGLVSVDGFYQCNCPTQAHYVLPIPKVQTPLIVQLRGHPSLPEPPEIKRKKRLLSETPRRSLRLKRRRMDSMVLQDPTTARDWVATSVAKRKRRR